MYVAAIQNIN